MQFCLFLQFAKKIIFVLLWLDLRVLLCLFRTNVMNIIIIIRIISIIQIWFFKIFLWMFIYSWRKRQREREREWESERDWNRFELGSLVGHKRIANQPFLAPCQSPSLFFFSICLTFSFQCPPSCIYTQKMNFLLRGKGVGSGKKVYCEEVERCR